MSHQPSTVEGPIFHKTATVGTSRVQFETGPRLVRGVAIKSSSDNAGTVYVANGFPLQPGESLFLPVSDPNQIHLVASDADQVVHTVGV